MTDNFIEAIVNLSGGSVLVADRDMDLTMVQYVRQPNGETIDRLMREGWIARLPNGGTFTLSDEGVKAYMRYVDGTVDTLSLDSAATTSAATCPDCDGLGYIGGEGTDVPSSCMNKFHELALNASFEHIAKVGRERDEFNRKMGLRYSDQRK